MFSFFSRVFNCKISNRRVKYSRVSTLVNLDPRNCHYCGYSSFVQTGSPNSNAKLSFDKQNFAQFNRTFGCQIDIFHYNTEQITLIFDNTDSGTVAELVRVFALFHSEWKVPSLNPGESRNYIYSQVGDGGLIVTRIDSYSG